MGEKPYIPVVTTEAAKAMARHLDEFAACIPGDMPDGATFEAHLLSSDGMNYYEFRVTKKLFPEYTDHTPKEP